MSWSWSKLIFRIDFEKTEGIYYSMLFFLITNMLINTDSGRTIQKKSSFCTFPALLYIFILWSLVVDLNALNMVVMV